MKTIKIISASFLVIAFTGCTTHNRVVINEPVGPSRGHPAPNNDRGSLVVYSALEVVDQVDSDHPVHTGYDLVDTSGKKLCHVDNRAGSFYQDPKTVMLLPGTYKVSARGDNTGPLMVSVLIAKGKTTVLDLNGRRLPQGPAQPGDEWVRSSNGQVVGAKAN